MATRLAAATANTLANAAAALVDGGAGAGTIKVRDGAQPAAADDPATGTLLLTFTLNDPAFAAAVAGVAALDVTPAITALGVASGTAGWFRLADSNGVTVLDGACATLGAQLNLSTTTISVGLSVSITSGNITQPES
jgi:hypothetical protein